MKQTADITREIDVREECERLKSAAIRDFGVYFDEDGYAFESEEDYDNDGPEYVFGRNGRRYRNDKMRFLHHALRKRIQLLDHYEDMTAREINNMTSTMWNAYRLSLPAENLHQFAERIMDEVIIPHVALSRNYGEPLRRFFELQDKIEESKDSGGTLAHSPATAEEYALERELRAVLEK